jgi:TRAP-type C4-dicarboxylate transport system substrate-binding protein
MIDAIPTIPLHALSNQFYLSTHHMLELNWLPLVGALIITKSSWDALSPAQRAAMMKSAEECGQQFQKLGRKEAEESVQAMQKRGLQVQPVSKDAQAEWEKFSQSFYPQVRGKIVPANTFDKVMQILLEYRGSPKVVVK